MLLAQHPFAAVSCDVPPGLANDAEDVKRRSHRSAEVLSRSGESRTCTSSRTGS